MGDAEEHPVRAGVLLLRRRWVLGMLGATVAVPWALGAQRGEAGLRLLGSLERSAASGQVGAVRLWGQWILRREDLERLEALTAHKP